MKMKLEMVRETAVGAPSRSSQRCCNGSRISGDIWAASLWRCRYVANL